MAFRGDEDGMREMYKKRDEWERDGVSTDDDCTDWYEIDYSNDSVVFKKLTAARTCVYLLGKLALFGIVLLLLYSDICFSL